MSPVGPDWAGSRVLVTGASGFIGGRLAERLVALGAEVHAPSRRPPPEAGQGVAWHGGDLGDIAFVRDLFARARPAAVFHLAGRVTGSQALDEVLRGLHATLVPTVNLLVGAVEAGGPRFVTAGSLVEPPEGAPRAVPSSPYAAAKWAAGDYARMVHALHGLPASVARVFMVYGPGQRDTAKLVPYTILSALRGERPRCAGGAREADWVHVDDVVGGLLALAGAEHAAGRTVDLGTGVLTSVRDVVLEIVRHAAPGIEPEFGARPDPRLEPVEAADVDATRRLIGWQARTALAEGIARTVAWYRGRYSKERE